MEAPGTSCLPPLLRVPAQGVPSPPARKGRAHGPVQGANREVRLLGASPADRAAEGRGTRKARVSSGAGRLAWSGKVCRPLMRDRLAAWGPCVETHLCPTEAPPRLSGQKDAAAAGPVVSLSSPGLSRAL